MHTSFYLKRLYLIPSYNIILNIFVTTKDNIKTEKEYCNIFRITYIFKENQININNISTWKTHSNNTMKN